jgi:DNA repair exonuclease SbcCD nuclease subunit
LADRKGIQAIWPEGRKLGAIENIGRLAINEGVSYVLVAGDVYDSETPSELTLHAPLERMKLFSKVQWHVLPGNHDPHRPQGIWERAAKAGLPANVVLHLDPRPMQLGCEAVLLPAPLTRKSEVNDITAWMDRAETQPGLVRIALAHGAIAGFDRESEAENPIDPTRPAKARLDYLALGDWHRTMQVGPSAWYAGTPEPDRAGSQEQGIALIVEVPGQGAPASVRSIPVGTYTWLTREETFVDGSELADMDARLRAIDNLSHIVLRLRPNGAITLAARADLQRRLVSLEAAMFHLDVAESKLQTRPTTADLEAIGFDGVLRRAADNLMGKMSDATSSETDRQRAHRQRSRCRR